MTSNYKIHHGNALDVLKTMEANSVDAVVTDPPYFLVNESGSGFMGKEWDGIMNLWEYLWSNPKFVQIVSNFLKSLQVGQNTAEAFTAPANVNIKASANPLSENAQFASVDSRFNDVLKNASVHLLVVTKADLLDSLNGSLRSPTSMLAESLNGVERNAQFVLPILLPESERNSIVVRNVTRLLKAAECQAKQIIFTRQEVIKIKDAIAAMGGNFYANKYTKEINGVVDFVESTADGKKFSVTTLALTDLVEPAKPLTLLLYALLVTHELSRIPQDLIRNFFTLIFREVSRVLKPGGHVLAFAGTRTYQYLASSIEDAGFQIRDQLQWIYGCLSDDTEILTSDGWKPNHKDILTHSVLCYNVSSDGFEFHRPTQHFSYTNKHTAYRIKSDSTDQIVSRNHRVLVERGGRKEFIYAEALEREACVPFLESLSELPDSIYDFHERASVTKQSVLDAVSGQSSAIQKAARGQTSSGFCLSGMRQTRTTLARIEPIEYNGNVWCVEVPTGAFVARRNGQIFITGNSGFPKSLDVSKAIDREAGAVREVTRTQTADYVSGVSIKFDQRSSSKRERRDIAITDAAKQWEGFGTALKPANENICLAQKPLIFIDDLDIMVREVITNLCKSKSLAKIVRQNLALNNPEQKEVVDIAQWLADKSINIQDVLSVLTATLRSELATNLNLSTVLLWLDILAAFYLLPNTSITETRLSLTIDLRILNSLPLANIAELITKGGINHAGDDINVLRAANIFNAVSMRFDYIRELSVQESVTSPVSGKNLRPNSEPICLARKPLEKGLTVAANVLKWGTGALNIDGCRVGAEERTYKGSGAQPSKLNNHGKGDTGIGLMDGSGKDLNFTATGRFPSNLIHDGSDEVEAEFAKAGISGTSATSTGFTGNETDEYWKGKKNCVTIRHPDSGSASRFFKSCEYSLKHDSMSVCKHTNANNVELFLMTIQATPGLTVHLNVQVLPDEQLVRNVKSAGIECERCATSIAQELVRIKNSASSREGLQAIQDFTGNFKNSIPHQNLVEIVIEWVNTDTILTTTNLLKLFGSVLLAIDGNISRGIKERVEQNAAPSRFLYQAKASRSERNRNLDGITRMKLRDDLTDQEREFVLSELKKTGVVG